MDTHQRTPSREPRPAKGPSAWGETLALPTGVNLTRLRGLIEGTWPETDR